MQEELARSYRHIQDFTHQFMDKRYAHHSALKTAYSECRNQIKIAVDKNENLKKILCQNNPLTSLLKEEIINCTLLILSHHALYSEIESYKPTFKGGK